RRAQHAARPPSARHDGAGDRGVALRPAPDRRRDGSGARSPRALGRARRARREDRRCLARASYRERSRRRRRRRARSGRSGRDARRAHRRRAGRQTVKAALVASLLLVASTARADLSILERFRHEPTVHDLQRAAARLAEVEPARVRSWLRRAGKAAMLPALRVRVGRGLTELTHEVDAQLYSARRRLQVEALQQPDAPAAIDRALQIDELTAVLDGLTDNALTKGSQSR